VSVPVEDLLRDLFAAEADSQLPPPGLHQRAVRQGIRLRRRRRAGQAACAAMLAGAAAAAAVLVPGAPPASHREPRPVASRATGSAGWTRLPDAPIAPRSEYAAVWTGKEMIVWGGYSNTTQYGDGAAYDPATRTWTKIAASPLAARELPVTVWTGKEMLIFGGVSNSGAYSDGAAYDPASNSWRKLAPVPGSLGNLTASGSYAVWTGKVMLAWGFFREGGGTHGGGSLAAAAYDPSTNTWTTGTAAPAQAPLFGDAFWTGTRMLVWGSSPASGVSPGHLEGFSYDPATRRWSALPASPLGQAGRASMLAAWTGSRMIVGGGASGTGLKKDAAAYDPVTRSWTRLPDAPVGFEGNQIAPDFWTRASVITIEDHVAGGRPLSLDLATGRWSLGPKAPVPGRQEAVELWTGSEVLVWGGGIPVGDGCCRTVSPAYSYAP
jgi:hypothetical protein